MGLVPKFNQASIRKHIDDSVRRIEEKVIEELAKVGERFINNARSKTDKQGGFKDQTGNLRSSIGYVVLKNGEQVIGGFPGGSKIGVETGKQVLSDIIQNYPRGYVLICVAGMNYAVYVESKAKDVITGSSQIAIQDLKIAVERIRKGVK